MISTILRFDIDKRSETDFRNAYHQLLTTLQGFPGGHRWFCGVNAPNQKPIPFEEEGAVLHRLKERAELMGIESFSAAVSSDNKSSRQPGLIEVGYSLGAGYMTVSLYRPDQVQANPTQLVVDIMLAVLAGERGITFAFADVYDKVDGEFQYYKSKYATFPHRKCVGWMAYVPKTVTQQQLPLAAAVLPAPGGSIVVTVDQAFDLANKDHIQRANEIEMDMNDLGLLPVIDPTF